MRVKVSLISGAIAGLAVLGLQAGRPATAKRTSAEANGMVVAAKAVTQGSLLLIRDRGEAAALECPLRHTDVQAEITGPLARVTVTQDFENRAPDKVEAVYVFPLPHNAAIDDMSIRIGDRVISGQIKRRAEAQAIYQAARNAGNVAALLDQERPNIFTQSIANLVPGARVRVVIRYVEQLTYDAGEYQFTFPMVVGPRYSPRGVKDAARIDPPVAPPDTRAGHDISMAVRIDAGVPIENLQSRSHSLVTERPAPARAVVRLREQQSIPNKDFVLRYAVAGQGIRDAVLTHRSGSNGYFTLMLQPPLRVSADEITPKEIVFVLDTSGSMSGFPIEKAKETIRLALRSLNPRDTFNLITFAGDTRVLHPAPVAATRENLEAAERFIEGQAGSGGTEMMKAIRTALDPSDASDHIRVVCFLTDGYVGNENEIIGEVKRHANARVFSFGIGSSVNRYLLDKMAEAGRGEVEYVGLQEDGSAAAKRFEERVRNPLLTDINVAFDGVEVTDVLPVRIPDLFAARPVIVSGRYTGPGNGTVRLTGKLSGGRVFRRDVPITLPAVSPEHAVLPKLWARKKIDVLASDPRAVEEVTKLGLEYRIMTAYTSFVAVEEKTVTKGGVSRRVEVPVEMPEGVSYDGVFGSEGKRGGPTPIAMRGAQSAMWAPTELSGVVGGVPAMPMKTVTPERRLPLEDVEAARSSKLDPALKGAKGSVRVRLVLAESNAEVHALLKQCGVEVMDVRPANVVTGRVDAARLSDLLKLQVVLWIGPIEGGGNGS